METAIIVTCTAMLALLVSAFTSTINRYDRPFDFWVSFAATALLLGASILAAFLNSSELQQL